jgi:hypothetical protein
MTRRGGREQCQEDPPSFVPRSVIPFDSDGKTRYLRFCPVSTAVFPHGLSVGVKSSQENVETAKDKMTDFLVEAFECLLSQLAESNGTETKTRAVVHPMTRPEKARQNHICAFGTMPSEAGSGHWNECHRGHGCPLDPVAGPWPLNREPPVHDTAHR